MLTIKQPRGLTAAYTVPVLVMDDGATTISSTNATVYSIDGKIYTVAAYTNQATPTTDGNTGAAFTALAINRGCVLVFCQNAAGTLQIMQGPIATVDATSEAFTSPDAPQFPFIPDASCPIGYTIAINDSGGSAWTPGTSNWNATGLNDATVDVSTLPARPPTDAVS